MLHRHSNKDLYFKIRDLARTMRKEQTPAEVFFWEKVRDRRLFGLKWNRQFIIPCPIDGSITKYYISDFHCNQYKLIIEIDGEIHFQQEEEDLIRTDRMGEYGFNVIRFSNDQVLNHWTEVERKINEFIHCD
ncbi:MAG: endonuclease domain-containing protein [Saprospiraceae bacterium]